MINIGKNILLWLCLLVVLY